MTISLDRTTAAVALLALCVALAPLCLVAEPGVLGTCRHQVGLVMRGAHVTAAEMSAGLDTMGPGTGAMSRAGIPSASRVFATAAPGSCVSPLPLRI